MLNGYSFEPLIDVEWFIHYSKSKGRRSTSTQSSLTDEKHIITETKPASLDNLLPVVRQILSKDPTYTARFGGHLSENKKYLVRQHARTIERAETLFPQILKDDLPHSPIVAFPSVEKQFHIGLKLICENFFWI
jgi:hypothetical protein